MANYYGFNHKTYTNLQPINPQKQISPHAFHLSLEHEMKKALDVKPERPQDTSSLKTKDQKGLDTRPMCCTNPNPCMTYIQHRPEFAGCGKTFISWNELGDPHPEYQQTLTPPRDVHYYSADLNELLYERHMINGSRWWPEGTAPHRNARQLFVQYLKSTDFQRSSPNEKVIDRVEDSLRYLQQKHGKPQYFSF